MQPHRGAFQVVHAGPSQAFVIQTKARGFYDVDGQIEAGGEAQDGARIARNVRLEEDQAQGRGRIVQTVSFWQRQALGNKL